jgi:tRNA C32,U32 (ribose-2'-O)-methylase TrmJ
MSRSAFAKTVLAALLLAAGLSSPAFARDQILTARLAQPLASPSRVIAQNTIWSCEGDSCRAVARHAATVRACRQFVREAGPVLAYGPEQAGLSAEDIALCNGQSAAQTQAQAPAPAAAN